MHKIYAIIGLVAAPLLAGCQSGPEGTYQLDKTEMKKAMEAELAKKPKEEQGFGKLAIAMIDAMDMSVELKKDGVLEMTSTKPAFQKDKPAKTEKTTGTWKKDGDAIVLDMDNKPSTCQLDGKKLTCQPDKPGEPAMTFIKS